MNRRNLLRFILLAAIPVFIFLFYYFDLKQYFTLSFIKAQQQGFEVFYQDNPFKTIFIFFSIYVVVTALSVPGAVFITLVGGALLGLWVATFVVSFASTVGATLAFLLARFVLRDWVQNTWGHRLTKVNKGIQEEGAFYLFTLRLVPLIPYFLINLAMGLTPLRIWTYFWVSQLGMLPWTFVYVNAGRQLGQIESLEGILSFKLILSLAVLGVFPLITKKFVDILRRKKHEKI